MSLKSVGESARRIGAQALAAVVQAKPIVVAVGDRVAKTGDAVGAVLQSAARELSSSSAKLDGETLRGGVKAVAESVEVVADGVRGAFARPTKSDVSSINFQAATGAGSDTLCLAAGAVSSAVPGIHWIGSGGVAAYGVMRLVPGLLARAAGREDAQSLQSIEAAKLIIGTAALAAVSPPVVASAVFASAMTVTARNASTLAS